MQTWIIILIILLVSTFLLIRFSVRIIYKFLGFILIIPALLLILYALNLGPFQTNYLSPEVMQNRFCNLNNEQSLDSEVCSCIVMPYHELLQTLWSPEEVATLHQNKGQAAYVFVSLYPELKEQVLECVGGNNIKMDSLFSHFTRHSIPFYKQSITRVESLIDFYTQLQIMSSGDLPFQNKIDSLSGVLQPQDL